MKKVSILIPCFNRVNVILACIRSAQQQLYQEIEIIIVDNNSQDGTWEIIKEQARLDNRIICHRNETNIGPVRNWSKCVELATGEYAKFLWSDDKISITNIQNTIKYMTEDVAFVYTQAELIDEKGSLIGKKLYDIGPSRKLKKGEYLKRSLFSASTPLSPGCALFRLDDLRKNLIVDIPNDAGIDFAKNAIGNDLLIFLLTINQYDNCYYLASSEAFFRIIPDSITVKTNKNKLKTFYLIIKCIFVEQHAKIFLNDAIAMAINDYLKNKIFSKNSQIVNWKQYFSKQNNLGIYRLFLGSLTLSYYKLFYKFEKQFRTLIK